VTFYTNINILSDIFIKYPSYQIVRREGKYGHVAVFPFLSKSKDNLPVVCMACNFGKG
jgi:hypothetical protein